MVNIDCEFCGNRYSSEKFELCPYCKNKDIKKTPVKSKKKGKR